MPGCADDAPIKATDEDMRRVFASQRLHSSGALRGIQVGRIDTLLTGLLLFYYTSGRKVKYESLSRGAYVSRFEPFTRAFPSFV